MDRRPATWLACGAAMLVLVVVSASGPVPLAERTPTSPWQLELAPPELPGPGERPPADDGEDVEWELPDLLAAAIQVLLFGAAVAATALVLAGGVRALRLLGEWEPRWIRWRRNTSPEEFEVVEDLAAAVSADAPAQQAALRVGAPRNAIVECWLRLENLVEEAGSPRHPAETATEFTTRVLALHHLHPVAIGELAALYREARFSDHPMGESQREAAIAALDDLHAGLIPELTSTGER